MNTCRSCQTELHPDFLFCEECGAPVRPCAACGHPNAPQFSFCEECGRPLRESVTIAPPAQPVPAQPPPAEPPPVPPQARPPVPGRDAQRSAQSTPQAPATRSRLPEVPARKRRRGRIAIVGTAAALAATAVAVGVATTGNGGDEATPIASPLDAVALLDTQDYNLAPNAGLEIESNEDFYTFEDHAWQVTRTDEIGLTTTERVGERVGHFHGAAGSTTFTHSGDPADMPWAESVLLETPGVAKSGSSWTIDDEREFATVIGATVPGGAWGIDDEGWPFLFRDSQMRFVFYKTGDGFAWALDEFQRSLFLLVPQGDELATAGAVVPDGQGYRFWQEPGVADAEVADRAFSDLSTGSGVLLAHGGDGIDAVKASFMLADTEANAFRQYFAAAPGPPLDYGDSTLQTGWALTSHSDDVMPNPPVAPGSPYTEAVPVKIGADLPFDKILGRYGCERPGPGWSTLDGSGAPPTQQPGRVLTPSGLPTAEDQTQMLRLAQAWMPPLVLAYDETCGWITRIVAVVHPYTADHQPTTDLDMAARVEITYTVFFDEDGGRFGHLHHPGDNEGFTVGLLRTELSAERCGLTEPHFQLGGGASSAHKGYGWLEWVPGGSGVVQKTHHDTGPSAWGGPCPDSPSHWPHSSPLAQPPRVSASDPYSVYASEDKHAIYFDHESCTKEMLRIEECGNPAERAPYDLSSWVEVLIADPAALNWLPCKSGEWSGGAVWPSPYEHEGGIEQATGSQFVCRMRNDGWATINDLGQIAIEDANYRIGEGFFSAPTAPPPLINQPDGDPIARPGAVPETTATTSGPKEIRIPDVAAMTWEEARTVLRESNLEPRQSIVRPPVSDDALVGRVIDQTPPAGSFAAQGTVVEVTLGGDKALVEVPDLVGYGPSAAARLLEESGLVPVDSGDEDVDPGSNLVGLVASQAPSAGSLVEPGSVVNYWIGVAADLVSVPALGGLSLDDANAAASGAGVELRISSYVNTDDDVWWDGRVVTQAIAQGTLVERGTIVWVEVEESTVITPTDDFVFRVTLTWWGSVDLDLDVIGPEEGVHGGDASGGCVTVDTAPLEEHQETVTWEYQPISGQYLVEVYQVCSADSDPSDGMVGYGGYQIDLEYEGGEDGGGSTEILSSSSELPDRYFYIYFDY